MDNTKISKEPRLYVEATFLSFRKNKQYQNPNQALLLIEGVHSKDEAKFYIGKKIMSIIQANPSSNLKESINWGIITQTHGNGGIVRAKFERNLPPTMIGKNIRVMLYPSTI